MDKDSTPGRRLRKLRREAGLSLEEAGRAWGVVSPCTVARWERDEKVPAIHEAFAICASVGLRPTVWLTSPLVMRPIQSVVTG